MIVPLIINRQESDITSTIESLTNGVLLNVIPVIVDKLKDLNAQLDSLMALSSSSEDSTESLLVLHGRISNKVSFSCMDSLKEFLSKIIPNHLLCFERIFNRDEKLLELPVPWSGRGESQNRVFKPVVIPKSTKIDERHQQWIEFQRNDEKLIEDVMEICLGETQSISRFVIKEGVVLHPVLPARILTQPIDESISNVAHFVIRSLCLEYSLLSSVDISVSRSGSQQTAFAIRIGSGSCHCLIVNRSHRNTKPNILLRRDSIYVKCFSNDCQGETKQLPWPVETERARVVLFP